NIVVGTTYTITETVAPAGYSLDATRSTDRGVGSGNMNVSLGTMGANDASDFHDFLGSISWEKRDGSNGNVLLAGATFSVVPNPQIGGSGSFMVTDNGANDVDPVAGEIRIVNIIAGGTYTITETVAPAGYSLDAT